MKKIFLFLFVTLAFIACKKKSTIHITAKNAVTGKPYPGLKYSVLRSKTGIFESHYKVVAEGTLDENGEAYITKRFSKNWSHDLSLEPPKNTCYSKKDDYYFSGGENVEANFEYAECGYMKRNITDTNCQGNDYMVLYSDNQVHSLGNTPWEFYNCDGFTASHYSTIPEGYYYYKWVVTRNNVTNTYYDTIYLGAGEYKTYTINY